MKAAILLLLLAATASAYTISDYPNFFVKNGKFSAMYVIADESDALDVVSATVISTALAKYPNITTEIGTSRLDSEITDITKYNAIIIAHPCESKAASQLEGNPVPCYKNLGGSAGYIKLFQHGDKTQMLITGLTPQDRHKAARFISKETLNNLQVTSYIIPTGTGSQPAFFTQKNESQTPPKNATTSINTTKNQTNTIQQTNQTEEKPKNLTKTTPAPKKVPPGEYEPLTNIPKKKSAWDKFWNWLFSLF